MMLLHELPELGTLTGVILLSVVREQEPEKPRRLVIEFAAGSEIGRRDVDPTEQFRSRFEPLLGVDDRTPIDLRVEVEESDTAQIALDPVAAVVSRRARLSGDEAFFVRYMDDVMSLLQSLTAPS